MASFRRPPPALTGGQKKQQCRSRADRRDTKAEDKHRDDLDIHGQAIAPGDVPANKRSIAS
jgi:hypothetical protein